MLTDESNFFCLHIYIQILKFTEKVNLPSAYRLIIDVFPETKIKNNTKYDNPPFYFFSIEYN